MTEQMQDATIGAARTAGAHETASRASDAAMTQQFEISTRQAQERSRRTTLLLRLAVAAGGLLLWEILSGPVLDPFFFSRPSSIATALWRWILDGQLAYHLGFTLTATLGGYLLGVTVGLWLAIVCGLVLYLYRVVEPLILILHAIPSVAIGPLLIIWFGIGLTPKVILAAFFVFFVVFMNTITGIRTVNRALVDIALVMGASRRAIILKIVLPNALPYIIAALRIALPTALVGAISGEFISSNRGLGYLILWSSSLFKTAQMFAALFVLASIVVGLNAALTFLEARLTHWKPQQLDGSRR